MMASNGVNRCLITGSGGAVGQTSQTTQTSLPSSALPSMAALGQQLTAISAAIAKTTTATTTAVANSHRKKAAVSRVNGSVLFEGAHIHYSPVDNKPLCSYSTKICKQRRINGYAFCIRHILEDPSAPFRQCRHVAKYNQQKCSNAIPATEDRLFCNSHMQIAGMAPKKERKDKRTNSSGTQSGGAKCGDRTLNTTNDKICFTSDEITNFNAFLKPSLKLNGINSFGNNNNNQNNSKFNNNCRKSVDKCTTTTSAPGLLDDTSISSHTNTNIKLNDINFDSNLVKNTSKVCNNNKNSNNCNKSGKKRTKRPKEKKSVDKFVFARKSRFSDKLFNYHIWSDSDDDIDERVDSGRTCRQTSDTGAGDDEVFPLIFGTLSTNVEDLEPNELKTELIAEKWLLQNLISVRRRDLKPQLERTRNVLKVLNRKSRNSYNYCDYKLAKESTRSPNCIRKGICCYTSDESHCRRPSLPFSRHCVDHILYNVDQLLFSRCTAKCAQTMTQCSRSTFDIIHEEPLCQYHQMVGQEVEERPLSSPTTESKNKKRRKSKPMALTRVSRRGKRRRKGTNGSADTSLPTSVVEDSHDSRLSVGSIDDDSMNSHSDTNDITINLLAQKEHNCTDIIEHTITQTIPQTTAPTVSTTDIVADIPLMRLQPLLTSPVVSSVAPTVPLVLDHTVMPPPPPLEPTEEALVASIVADLPQLTSDTDFTDVLNKIPDDAFSEFLLEHQNGDIPTTEETEALEQALAMVNKDVQNLVAAATMNGTAGSAQYLSDFSGQSDIIGFTNWLGSLTTEQRQQLNGLIDGAIASNSLSPILKNACEVYPQTLASGLQSGGQPMMKSTTNTIIPSNPQSNAFPVIYPLNQLSLAPTPQQEFVQLSPSVPLLSNNLLMNGLSSHPS